MTRPALHLAQICCFLLLIAGGAPAWADPPTRVGRISLVEGGVSLRHGEDPQWNPAGINYPVIAGDSLWADRGARAELEVGGAEARLDAGTLLSVVRLDDDATQLRVDQGVINLTVRFMPAGGLQLVTAAGQMDIRQPGEYHVDAGRPGGPATQIVMGVLSGEAMFNGPRGGSELHYGQGAMMPPDQSQMTVVAVYATPFDQWAEDRARSLEMSQSAQYVSPDMTGYQDLDRYGRWETVPEYGPVWYPTRIDAGWAPYRWGHWAYVQPWGWTWIDDAPWGFAPFHYGRWAEFEGRWAWIPGERRERPCYAPALVAFIGGGPGGGIGVGWVPLGPREVFHPYYHVSDRYVHDINRPHVTNVTQINVTNVTVNNYVNRGAVTAVNNNTFTGGHPVHEHLEAQAMGQMRQQQAPVMANLNHLTPVAAPTPAAQPAPHPGGSGAGSPGAGGPGAGGGFPRQGAAPTNPQPQPAAMPQPQQQPHPAAQPQPQPQAPRPAPAAPPSPQPQPQPPHPAPPAPAPQVQQPHPPAPAPQPQQRPQQQQPAQQQQRPNPEKEKEHDHR